MRIGEKKSDAPAIVVALVTCCVDVTHYSRSQVRFIAATVRSSVLALRWTQQASVTICCRLSVGPHRSSSVCLSSSVSDHRPSDHQPSSCRLSDCRRVICPTVDHRPSDHRPSTVRPSTVVVSSVRPSTFVASSVQLSTVVASSIHDSVGGVAVEVFLGEVGTYVCTESCCCDAVVTPGLWAVWAVSTWGRTRWLCGRFWKVW